MTTNTIHFRCAHCKARIKAPVQLLGRQRDCPGCNHSFTVPYYVPQDAGPILVLVEGNDRCSLGVAYQRAG